jgi:hypothetical protein
MDTTIIVATESGNVYFMDNTGQNVRSVALTGKIYATPSIAGTLVLVAPTSGDNTLVALDLTGAIKWSYTAK